MHKLIAMRHRMDELNVSNKPLQLCNIPLEGPSSGFIFKKACTSDHTKPWSDKD